MTQKAFISSLDLYFQFSIVEFRVEEKIHTKAVIDVSGGAQKRVFLISWERLREGKKKPNFSNKFLPEDLNMKFRSKFIHLLIVAICTVLF